MKYPLMNEAGEGEGGGAPAGEQPNTPEFNILDTAPDYAKDWDEVKNAKSAEDFWQWADNLRSFRGRAIALPGEDAGEEQIAEVRQKLMERMPDLVMMPKEGEDRAAFFRQLGMPEEASQYNLDREGFEPDESRFDAMREAAHKAGLTADQFNTVFGSIADMEAAAAEEAAQANAQAMSELKTEWGQAFDQKLQGVRRFMEQMGMPEAWRAAEANGQFGAADYKAMENLMKQTVGESAPGATNGGEAGKLTPAEAQAKIDEIRSNPEHPFNNPQAEPGARQRAQQQMLALYEMLPGGRGNVETAAFGAEM